MFSLTDEGRAAVTASRRHRRDWLKGRLDELTAAERDDIARVVPLLQEKHCGQFIGEEISPALTWDALPVEAKDLVLVIEDLDVPTAVPGIHTIAAFEPAPAGLPEGAVTPADSNIRFIPNRRRQAKYVGPRPLPGHGTHRYRFHLYALDTVADFTELDIEQLPSALQGHVLASGTLTGTRTT